MRLLVVEDNPENWDMLSRRLQRRGFEVLHAEDGPQAISMARDDQPDAILLDLSLPTMDGFQVASAIRERETVRRVPIIALTAHALQEDRTRALQAGCDEYETKPVDFDRLLSKIQALTGEPSNAE